jgi:hypothetical protein
LVTTNGSSVTTSKLRSTKIITQIKESGYGRLSESAPGHSPDIRTYFFAKRKKDVIEFGFEDSGKTCRMATKIENEGRKSPYDPMVSVLIP